MDFRVQDVRARVAATGDAFVDAINESVGLFDHPRIDKDQEKDDGGGGGAVVREEEGEELLVPAFVARPERHEQNGWGFTVPSKRRRRRK